MLELLEAIIGIPSVTGQEKELAVYCENLLKRCGFTTRRQYVERDRFNLLAEKGSGRSLLLYAHLDTVPPSREWLQDPYQLKQNSDRLYGLGVSDMKAGLVAILHAVHQVEPQGYQLKIALTVDEEAYSQGAYQLVQSPWCKDICHILVPELGITSENEHLVIGRRGHFCFDLKIYGKRVHGAVAENSDNAIEIASRIVIALKEFPLISDPHLGQETIFVRRIQADEPGLSVPEMCELSIHCLSLPERTEIDVKSDLQNFIMDYTSQFELTPYNRPNAAPIAYKIDENNSFVVFLTNISTGILPQIPQRVFSPSVADENILYQALKVPVVSLAPVGGRSHQADEWVSISSLKRVAEIYRRLLEQYSTWNN